MGKYWKGILLVLAAWPAVATALATEADDYQSALSAYQQGQFTQAVQGFARVVREDPNSWQAYQGMGSSMLQQGDRTGALQAYQKSLALHPDNPPIKAMVEKLSGPAAAATPSAANAGAQPSPASSPSAPKFSPILVHPSGPDSESYLYQGVPLENDDQFKNVMDLLHDPETDRLLQDSRNKDTAGLVGMIGGGALVAAGIGYYVLSQGTTQTVPGPVAFTKVTPADLTPAFILGGAGVAIGLTGGILEGDSRQEKYDAVDRYDHLIGQDPHPTPTSSLPAGTVGAGKANGPGQ